MHSKGIDIHFHSSSIQPEEGEDNLIATRENRSGVQGYRVRRFVLCPKTSDFVWDERYKFYLTLDDVMSAFEKRDYKSGEEAF